ncbi:MAG: CPBP family intramembrane glutamic endopeptidase [Bacteroidota bacterium]
MKETLLSGLKPAEQIILTVLVFLLAGVLISLVAIGISALVFHLPLKEVSLILAYPDESGVGVLKLVQILSGIGNYILAALLISRFLTGGWFTWFRSERKPGIYGLLLVLLIMIASLPLVNFVTEFNLSVRLPFDRLQQLLVDMEEKAAGITWLLTGAENGWGLAVNILMIAIIPGLGEELIFRGLLQTMFTRWFRNGHLAVFITAVIFSALHLQFLSFLSRLVLGLILGYLFYYGRSIWYPVLAHTFNNFMGVLFYYSGHKEGIHPKWDELGTRDLFPWSALISLISLLIIFYFWYRTCTAINQGPQDGPYRKA